MTEGTDSRDEREPIPDNLTDKQRDGLACVRCHATHTTMAPFGHVGGCQVFACSPQCERLKSGLQIEADASTRHDCPSWCEGDHARNTNGSEHVGEMATPIETQAGASGRPADVVTQLRQKSGSAPVLSLAVCTVAFGDAEVELSLSEAERLAGHLTGQIHRGRASE